MSTVQATLPTASPSSRDAWTERIGDWFNPILVKEVRQALKSRQFVLTFLLLLVGSWLVSFLSIMWMGDELEFGNAGARVFWWYYLVLAVAMFVIVPFTAFRSLLAERDDNTLDLLSITTLSPRQVVRGKLLSAMVQLFIFYSAVAPFVAFSSMLKGFSGAEVLYVLVLSLLSSVLLCVFSLMVSTLAKQRMWQMLLAFALLVGLVALFLMFAVIPFGFRDEQGFAGMIVSEPLPWREPWFWFTNVVFLLIALSYAILFGRIAVARLTFESDNRSTAIRVVCFLQFVLVWTCSLAVWSLQWIGEAIDGWYVVGWTAPYLKALNPARSLADALDDIAPVLVSLSLVHFFFVGLFAATETEELSRRLRRDLPKSGFLRFLVTPWMPGGGRGYLYVLGCLFSLWFVTLGCLALAEFDTFPALLAGTIDHSAVAGGEIVQFVTAGCCYVAIYAGIGCLLVRLMMPMSGEIKSSHVRIVTVLVALVGIIVPYLIRASGIRAFRDYSLLLITVPFDTLHAVYYGREYADVATLTLIVVAGLVVLVNLPALLRGFGELHEADPERLRRIDAARHSD